MKIFQVNYTFRVVAVNSHGRSEPGMKSGVLCNTKPSFPYKNPTNVSAAGTDPHNLVIYWQPMDKEDWNAKDFLYVIRYRLNEQGAEWHEFRVEDPLAVRSYFFSFLCKRSSHLESHYYPRSTDLPRILGPSEGAQRYRRLHHRASQRRRIFGRRQCVQFSDSTCTLVAMPPFSEPDAPPDGFEASEFLNATSVRFTWNHVDRSTVNGHFKGYKVKCRYLLSYSLQQLTFQIQTWPVTERSRRSMPSYLHNTLVDAEHNTFVLHDFEPMGEYRAHILTVNQDYVSDPSKSVKFTMPEGSRCFL